MKLPAIPELDLGLSFEAELDTMASSRITTSTTTSSSGNLLTHTAVSRDPFLPLPNELFNLILSFLQFEHLLQLSMVSRRFHEFALLECISRYKGVDGDLYLTHTAPVLTVLLSARFPIHIPFLHYSFSHLNSDQRLLSEVGRFCRVLKRRPTLQHSIDHVVLEFRKISSLLFRRTDAMMMDQSEHEPYHQNPTSSVSADAFQELFDQVVAVSSLFTIRCGNLDDTSTILSSSTVTAHTTTSHHHQHRRSRHRRQRHRMALSHVPHHPPKPSFHSCIHAPHPKAFFVFLRSILTQCTHRYAAQQCDDSGLQEQEEGHSIVMSPTSSSSRPVVTEAIALRTLSSFSIQNSSMLFRNPLLAWTIKALRNPSSRSVSFSHIDLSSMDWSMILPGIYIPMLEALVIEACDIPLDVLCVFLRRHSSTIRRLVLLPDSANARPSMTPGALKKAATLVMPKLEFIRAPPSYLTLFFSHYVPASSSAMEDNIPSSSDSYTIPASILPQQPRERFPCLREISIAVDVPSGTPTVDIDSINPTISHLLSTLSPPLDESMHTEDSFSSILRPGQVPDFSLFLSIENPRTALQWLKGPDLGNGPPGTGSLTHFTSRERNSLPISPPVIPHLHLPPSPPPPLHLPPSPIPLHLPTFSPPRSSFSPPPAGSLFMVSPAAPSPPPLIHAPIALSHHLPLPPTSAPSSPPILSAQQYQASGSGALSPLSLSSPVFTAMVLPIPAMASYLHLVTTVTVRAELYRMPEAAWEELPRWIARSFGPPATMIALTRFDFVDWDGLYAEDDLAYPQGGTNNQPKSPPNSQRHHHPSADSSQTISPPRRPTLGPLAPQLQHTCSLSQTPLMLKPESQAKVAAALKSVCPRLEIVRIGGMERSVEAWDGIVQVTEVADGLSLSYQWQATGSDGGGLGLRVE